MIEAMRAERADRLAELSGLMFAASDFAGRPVPPRQFIVPGLIPAENVTMLGGDGGLGKSTMALQGCVALVSGGAWLGRVPQVIGGPERGYPPTALYLSAEDDAAELHRRLHDTCLFYGVDLASLTGLHLLPMAERDAILAVEGGDGNLVPTDTWRALAAKIAVLSPDLVVLDSLADVFGGNEVNRAHARQFIAMLRRLAITAETAFLVLAHPSLAGMASGSGTSGSTHWHNAVRSRLYLSRPDDDGGPADPNLRLLSHKKANYSALASDMRLRRRIGGYVLEDEVAAGPMDVDRLFLDLLDAFAGQGRKVTHTAGHGYAPALFAEDPAARAAGVKKKALGAAMSRLFAANRIRVEESGPPSKRTRHIVKNGQEDGR